MKLRNLEFAFDFVAEAPPCQHTAYKREVRKLVESLPANATRDQAMDEPYVRQKIAEGEEAVAKDRVVPHEDVKKRFSRA